MAVIPVDIAGAPYEVRIGTGLLANLVEHCSGRLRKHLHDVADGRLLDCVHEDRHGQVWIGSRRGLARYTPSRRKFADSRPINDAQCGSGEPARCWRTCTSGLITR